MREIKFRAWNTVSGEWVETIHIRGEKRNREFDIYSFPITPAKIRNNLIVEQYTGLKDKNGKKIYDGDIVKVCGKHVSFVHMHPCGEWVLPQFLDKEDKPITSLLWHCDKKQVEVIGNIHENPELLKEEE